MPPREQKTRQMAFTGLQGRSQGRAFDLSVLGELGRAETMRTRSRTRGGNWSPAGQKTWRHLLFSKGKEDGAEAWPIFQFV